MNRLVRAQPGMRMRTHRPVMVSRLAISLRSHSWLLASSSSLLKLRAVSRVIVVGFEHETEIKGFIKSIYWG